MPLLSVVLLILNMNIKKKKHESTVYGYVSCEGHELNDIVEFFQKYAHPAAGSY